MAPLGLISVAGLSLLLGQAAGDPVAKNAALLPLSQSPKVGGPEESQTDFWSKVCAKITGTGDAKDADPTVPKGTYAYFPTSESAGNCAAAVEFWKEGFSLFDSQLPEKYSASSPGVYGNAKAVSFVALFNPKPNPTISCAFVKCPTTTTTTTTTTTKQPEVAKPGVGGRRLASEGDTTTVNAVVCLTNPDALVDEEAPFSQSVWDKIAAAVSNGVSPAGPTSLVALAAVALSASVLL
ncbi:SAG family member [Eimeria praecox]|uniref:SAG family member n=1 Tax=Eimeria praecox TaxID=51316 RepID=U6GNJ8_9EIME|nr:SAG family member [Eimeria praecox]